MKWDRTVGEAEDGLPVLYIKHLVHLFGMRIDLHKIRAKDPNDVFHSHPATAIRLILKNGYWEEVPESFVRNGQKYFRWGGRGSNRIGIVRPGFVHRIFAAGPRYPAYSLWFRGRITHDIHIYNDQGDDLGIGTFKED